MNAEVSKSVINESKAHVKVTRGVTHAPRRSTVPPGGKWVYAEVKFNLI